MFKSDGYLQSSNFEEMSTWPKKEKFIKCEICGNIVAVMQGGDGDLVCCGEDMLLVSESEANDFLAGLPKIGVI